LDERNFDSVALAWSGAFEYDPKQIWHSSSDTPSGSNFIGYKNPEVDKLIDQARETIDKKSRIRQMRKIYELIAADVPYIFMFNSKYTFYGHTSRMKRVKDTYKYDVGIGYWWIQP
jgi:peptide/nickel transport system substrate-binding protein/microcin C transport system substrate-binding protein